MFHFHFDTEITPEVPLEVLRHVHPLIVEGGLAAARKIVVLLQAHFHLDLQPKGVTSGQQVPCDMVIRV